MKGHPSTWGKDTTVENKILHIDNGFTISEESMKAMPIFKNVTFIITPKNDYIDAWCFIYIGKILDVESNFINCKFQFNCRGNNTCGHFIPNPLRQKVSNTGIKMLIKSYAKGRY